MDSKAKVWQQDASSGDFRCIAELKDQNKQTAHEDWVRDVAWSNNVGVMKDMIATVSEDQKLKIWKSEGGKEAWVVAYRHQFTQPVWRCSWSPISFMLAVSGGDNMTRVF
jgi:protein transport protein SEC13